MPVDQQRLALSRVIGFLVGVERGWRARDVAEGGRAAGIRTYALAGLLGGMAGLLSAELGGWAFAALGLRTMGRERRERQVASILPIAGGPQAPYAWCASYSTLVGSSSNEGS